MTTASCCLVGLVLRDGLVSNLVDELIDKSPEALLLVIEGGVSTAVVRTDPGFVSSRWSSTMEGIKTMGFKAAVVAILRGLMIGMGVRI